MHEAVQSYEIELLCCAVVVAQDDIGPTARVAMLGAAMVLVVAAERTPIVLRLPNYDLRQ